MLIFYIAFNDQLIILEENSNGYDISEHLQGKPKPTSLRHRKKHHHVLRYQQRQQLRSQKSIL